MASKKSFYPILVVLLALISISLGYLLYQQQQETITVLAQLEQTSSEKTEVTNELNGLLDQYESLKTNNDSLNEKLNTEQEKIKKMLKNLKKVKYSNAEMIKQYKKETETLRRIMRSYVGTIDSLNTLNEELIAENTEVKNQYQLIVDEKDNLMLEKDSLAGQVEEAASVRVFNISATGLNKRDRETNRVNRLEKIKTCLTLKENSIAVHGSRTIYVRIAKPSGEILYESSEDLFQFGDQMIAYSAKRDIEYEGKNTDVCVYYTHVGEFLPIGTYTADFFVEGNRVNTIKFELK